jgi:hypothetical protein
MSEIGMDNVCSDKVRWDKVCKDKGCQDMVVWELHVKMPKPAQALAQECAEGVRQKWASAPAPKASSSGTPRPVKRPRHLPKRKHVPTGAQDFFSERWVRQRDLLGIQLKKTGCKNEVSNGKQIS